MSGGSKNEENIQHGAAYVFGIVFVAWGVVLMEKADFGVSMVVVSEKNVLLLISTVNSGKTAARALECIEYYGDTTQGVAAVFSALKQVGDIPVISLFSPEDIPGYMTSLVKDCPMCKAGQKIDALSNSYGFSPLT